MQIIEDIFTNATATIYLKRQWAQFHLKCSQQKLRSQHTTGIWTNIFQIISRNAIPTELHRHDQVLIKLINLD